MPLQKPISRSISMSYSVRERRRCASSILPSASSSGRRVAQLGVDRLDRRLERASLHRVVRRRVDREVVEPGVDLARQRVEVGDRLDLVAEEADPVGRLGVGRLHLDHVAADAEPAAAHDRVVSLVMDVDQLRQDRLARLLVADRHEADHVGVRLGRADAVDARDRGDDDDVAPGEERRGRRVPQPVDVVVDRGVLLDVRVGRRQVRLGLVVVVVADEVLDRVRREVLPELVAELRGERLVVGDDERRLLDLLDHARHGVRLARGGGAEQRLVAGRRG